MNSAKWLRLTLILILSLTLSVIATVIIIDPFFHYHAPLKKIKYYISYERYQNDGILRNFDYDSFITGTSMTSNFKSSQFDALFNAKSVKIPFLGSSYYETAENIRRARKYNPKLTRVLRSLDITSIADPPNALSYDIYPTYLYDDNPFNDIYYILSKDVLKSCLEDILNTIDNGETTDFDFYGNWNSQYSFGRDFVLSVYGRRPQVFEDVLYDEERFKLIYDNLNANVVSLAKENPQIHFTYFIPPYSIVYWDECIRLGRLDEEIATQKMAIELLLPLENVSLYSFDTTYDIICNLDNYKDAEHYSEEINAWILEKIHTNEYELTEDNYESYLDEIKAFYGSYDYDGNIFSDYYPTS